MWSIYETSTAILLTIWVIMLLLFSIGYFTEILLCGSEREQKLVDKKWMGFNIAFLIITVLNVIAFIFLVKFGISK